MLLLLRLEKFASLRWREFFWKIKKWSRFSDEISILLKQICERLDASTKALDRAAGRIVYLENFQPQGIPGEISDVTGRPKDRYTRGYYTSNPRAKLLAALAMIPDLPWEKCNV